MSLKSYPVSLASIFIASPSCNSIANENVPPNILVIMTDQQRLDAGLALTSILTGRLTESLGIRTYIDSNDNKHCDYKT
jgi:hypothetical protein